MTGTQRDDSAHKIHVTKQISSLRVQNAQVFACRMGVVFPINCNDEIPKDSSQTMRNNQLECPFKTETKQNIVIKKKSLLPRERETLFPDAKY